MPGLRDPALTAVTFVPKITQRAQAERRVLELRPREPNQADNEMRRVEQLRGVPQPQAVDLGMVGSWTVAVGRGAGLQILEQLNGDVHVVITSRDLASAVFKQVADSLKGFSFAVTTAGKVMDGWRRANKGLLDGLFTIPAERSYRMPRRRARKPGPPWRRRRRR